MKRMFINVWPNTRNQLTVEEFTSKYIDYEFENKEFRYSDSIDEYSAIDLIVMANTDRLVGKLKSYGFDVKIHLTHSVHPNYSGYLLYFESKTPLGNISPIVARFFSWERIEHPSSMQLPDFLHL